MSTVIPSTEEIRTSLQALSHAETKALAEVAEVPFTTLWKIRTGETDDPRLETVRKLLAHMPSLRKSKPRKKAEA